MTNVCHLFDSSTGWEQRVGASQLLDRLPTDRFTHRAALIDRSAVLPLRGLPVSISILARSDRFAAFRAPVVARFLRRGRIDVVHAWGLRAAVAAAAAGKRPVVLSLACPASAARHAKLLRTLTDRPVAAVACGSETVRRRLIEAGVTPHRCVVIRPGVHLGLITRFRRGTLRRRLGVSARDFLLIAPPDAAGDDGQEHAYWAANLLDLTGAHTQLAVPGHTHARNRLARLASRQVGRRVLVDVPSGTPFEAVIAVADALILAPRGDTSTTCIAWAMASETAVIGSAVHGIAELIAHGQNGLLFKIAPNMRMALAIARCIRDRDAQTATKELARAQAYEVFSLQHCIEQHARLYENVLNRIDPGSGIVDSARAS